MCVYVCITLLQRHSASSTVLLAAWKSVTGSLASAHLTASHCSVEWQHLVTPGCADLLQFSLTGDIECRLPGLGAAFADAVVVTDVILKAKRVRNFPASVLACCWMGASCGGASVDGAVRLWCHCHSSPLIYSLSFISAATRVSAHPHSHWVRLRRGLCWGIVSITLYQRGYREAEILLVSWQTSV